LGDVFGIDVRFKSIVEFNKDINLVKGAICCCDKFTTVSKTYAEEITFSPEFSNGLNGIISQNKYKTSGIINGIDYDFYNPKTDNTVFKNYDIKNFEAKKENKVELQKMFGLNVDPEIPMISVVTRMASHKGMDLIKEGIEQILYKKVQLVIVGSGTQMYENFFKYLEQKYQGKVKAAIGYSNTLARKAYAASDIFIMPSKTEPCGLAQMIASRYGAIPVVRETGGLKDTIRDFGCEGGGNGYTFSNYNTNDLVYSINRALDDYYNNNNWAEKIKICMKRDFSWKGSAVSYIDLYRELV
jgi:starch synthase